MSEPPLTGEPDASREFDLNINNAVFNSIRELHVQGLAQMGIVAGTTSRTGPLLDQEIDERLRYYVRPDSFDGALRTLRVRHLVILRGPEGIGKRAGGLALLDAAGVPRPMIGVSPVLILDEVIRTPFRRGHGYMVQDQVHGAEGHETIEYQLDELARKLVQAGAYLVVTTRHALPGAPTDLVVDWTVPDPLALLAHHMERLAAPALTEGLATRVEERFRGCRTPREIVEFVTRLCSVGRDAEAQSRLLQDSGVAAVSRLLDADPPVETVLEIAVLAFVEGIPEAQFERALAALEAKVRHQSGSAPDEEDSEEPGPPLLVQRRRLRLDNLGLVTVQRDRIDSSESLPERRLIFQSSAYRANVLTELWNRYDNQLWGPILEWLHDLVARTDDDMALSVARGVAVLAREAPAEVRNQYLNSWAGGNRAARRAAGYTIWFACLDDELAAFCLDIVTRWATSASDAERTTAIFCLSGVLGQRYPGEALRWLWHLGRPGSSQRHAARRAIASLFRETVATEQPDLAVLHFVRAKLGPDEKPDEIALDVFSELLATRATSGGPAVAALIAKRLDSAAVVGHLWAKTLQSRRRRAAAIDALVDSLTTIDRRDEAHDAIEALLGGIVDELPDYEVRVLGRDLRHELTHARDGAGLQVAALVEALIASAQREPAPTKGETE